MVRRNPGWGGTNHGQDLAETRRLGHVSGHRIRRLRILAVSTGMFAVGVTLASAILLVGVDRGRVEFASSDRGIRPKVEKT